MFRQNLQQLCFRAIDLVSFDAEAKIDGFKIPTGEMSTIVKKELIDLGLLETKYEFIGDYYKLCPREVGIKLSKLLFDLNPNLESKFYKVLGRFNLDISYQYMTVYTGNAHRQSLLWHHDSVGQRLKVFIPLYSTISVDSLFWESNTSHTFKKPVYRDQRKAYSPINEIFSFGSTQDEILILNTNCMHCGNPNLPSGSVRNMFVLEFSNKLKSKVFAKAVGIRKLV
jgi:hypothetical protein